MYKNNSQIKLFMQKHICILLQRKYEPYTTSVVSKI